ncbi:hypothetical protein D3C71_2104870 [compost metagenome]
MQGTVQEALNPLHPVQLKLKLTLLLADEADEPVCVLVIQKILDFLQRAAGLLEYTDDFECVALLERVVAVPLRVHKLRL